jgi:hypothetical protein
LTFGGLSWEIIYRASSPLVASLAFTITPLVETRRQTPIKVSENYVLCYMNSERTIECLRPFELAIPLSSHFSEEMDTYAMILTLFPCAFSAILSASLAALASMDPEGGTVAVMTSIPLRASASRIPRQYWIPGRFWPARRSSSKPKRP